MMLLKNGANQSIKAYIVELALGFISVDRVIAQVAAKLAKHDRSRVLRLPVLLHEALESVGLRVLGMRLRTTLDVRIEADPKYVRDHRA